MTSLRFSGFDCLKSTSNSIKNNLPYAFMKFSSTFENPQHNEEIPKEVNLFGSAYCSGNIHKDINDLFNLARKSLMLLNNSANKRGVRASQGMEAAHLKKEFFDFLNFILEISKTARGLELIDGLEDNLLKLRLLAHKLSLARLPEHTLAFYSSTLGLNENSAVHLVHCHFDLRWLFICIIRSLEQTKANAGNTQTQAGKISVCTEDEVMNLISELIWLAIVRYEKSDKVEISKSTAFPCVCVKQLWLLIMHFPYENQNFWSYFNQSLQVVFEAKEPCSLTMYNSLKVEAPDFLPCSNRNEFALWFLAEISRLVELDIQGNKIDITQRDCDGLTAVEDILRSLLAEGEEGPSESSMRNVLPLVFRIQAANGHSRNTSILVLCDFFFKRINSSFYLSGSKLNANNVISKNAKALMDDVKSRLGLGAGQDRENSFFAFMRLLGEHLKYNSQNNISSSRLCSRVFLKFPSNRPEKYSEFLECGIYHVSILYLTLALGSKTPSIVNRLLELLTSIPYSNGMKESKHEMIWKSYGASLLTLAEMRGDLAGAFGLIMKHLDWCLSQPCLSPLTLLIDALNTLFDHDMGALKGIHSFLGPWIRNYVTLCRKNDKTRLFSVLIKLLQRILNCPGSSESFTLKSKVDIYVMPLVSLDESPQSAELAALCALHSNKHRSEMFRQWSDHQDFVLSGIFLSTIILHKGPESIHLFPQLPSCVQQVWTRCCFVWGDSPRVIAMAQCILEMNFNPAIKLEMNAPSRFKDFIRSFSIEYSMCQTIFDKTSLRSLFCSFFPKFDITLWNKCEEMDNIESETLERFYDYASEMVATCPYLIYSKSDPRCIFKAIVDSLVLTRAAYRRDQRLSEKILSAVNMTLPRFILGFFALGPESDPYIKRILRDTLSLYLPRLINVPVATHPISILLSNSNVASQTIAFLSTFLASDEKAMVAVLKSLRNILSSHLEISPSIFDEFYKNLIHEMIHLDGNHPLQGHALNFFSVTMQSARHREFLASVVSNSCQIYLRANAMRWFEVLRRLAPLCRLELSRVYKAAEESVTLLETQRRVERDVELRQMLQNLRLLLGTE